MREILLNFQTIKFYVLIPDSQTSQTKNIFIVFIVLKRSKILYLREEAKLFNDRWWYIFNT